MILGQLARLDPADARVVAAAAVIGREFELSLLARSSTPAILATNRLCLIGRRLSIENRRVPLSSNRGL